MKMNQFVWELWLILSMALLVVLGIVAYVIPLWLCEIFNIDILLSGVLTNLVMCTWIGLRHTKNK